MSEEIPTRKRGGNVKQVAPAGFYTASQAMRVLGLNKRSFYDYVNDGKIKKYTPPLRKEGFYKKDEIDHLADEWALFLAIAHEERAVETRVALLEDIPGIVAVLMDRGWRTTTVEQRAALYTVNPLIDFVILRQGIVVGYINAVAYKPQAMEDILRHIRRAWDMFPSDVYAYIVGTQVDLYVGVATRQDIPHPEWFSAHLIIKFLEFLQNLAKANVIVRRMYAVSAEPPGQKLCKKLGFVEMEIQPDYLFPDWKRYVLDLETSDSHFARQYRESLPQ